MGGRGGRSGVGRYGGGGITGASIDSTRSMLSEVAEGTRRQEAKDVLSVSRAVMREYGDSVQLADFEVAKLKGRAKNNVIAYYDGQNIAINETYFNSPSIESAYAWCVQEGFHPSNGNKTAMQAVAAHEYGHALTDFAAQKMGVTGIDAFASRIVEEARKITGHRGVVQMAAKISGYATHSNAEAVAEAYADVYCNKGKATKESKAIFGVLNKYLKGR